MTAPGAPTASGWQVARIERLLHRTARIVSVFLASDLGAYEAGQHVDVRLTAPDGYQAQRSYSIASAPGAPLLELAIERLVDGEVSPYFHDVAQAGDTIELRGPIGGHFIWRAQDGGPLLLLGGGSGIVPLMSMLRHRAAAVLRAPALLVYSARTWDDLAYRDELFDLESRDGLSLAITTTRQTPRRAGDFGQRLDAPLLQGILAQWGASPARTYVCGSNAFVERVTQALVGTGVPAATIRVERYGGMP